MQNNPILTMSLLLWPDLFEVYLVVDTFLHYGLRASPTFRRVQRGLACTIFFFRFLKDFIEFEIILQFDASLVEIVWFSALHPAGLATPTHPSITHTHTSLGRDAAMT
jgi:hypothetical protein